MPPARAATGLAGFTLLELTVVAIVLVALAAILVPVLWGESEEAKCARAVAETNAIAQGLQLFVRDIGRPPTGLDGRFSAQVLFGPGSRPDTQGAFPRRPSLELEDFLVDGDAGGPRWRGPYVESLHDDPWGNAYAVSARGWYTPGERVWVLSGGPNGTVETNPAALEAAGDDIGVILE